MKIQKLEKGKEYRPKNILLEQINFMMKMMLFKIATATIALFVVNTAGVDANNKNNYQAVSVTEFQSYWIDAMDIVDDLDSYDKLWIKPHSCVWSECAVDDTDDGYMGDNRDGDEQWYQYRTQGFCANAAYSLYGKKKGQAGFTSCSRGHFINSFFTYGGADTLLKSIGESPVVYTYNDDDNNGDDDGYSSTNAACNEIEYEPTDDFTMPSDDGADDDDDNAGSGSNDNDGYSGTLGCGPNGEYVVAAFQSESCDGNYFAGIADEFKDYNRQHNSIGCHKIYNGNAVSTENVMMLLNNSWSCDLRLYPNGCPDPYGKKREFDWAMRTINQGGNPQRAYKNMIAQTPIHVTSWTLFVITSVIFVVTFLIKNEARAVSKGGRNLKAYAHCLVEDIGTGCRKMLDLTGLTGRRRRKKKKSKKKSDKKSKKKKSSKQAEESSDSTEHDDIYVKVEDKI
jgi:hypothetical protein